VVFVNYLSMRRMVYSCFVDNNWTSNKVFFCKVNEKTERCLKRAKGLRHHITLAWLTFWIVWCWLLLSTHWSNITCIIYCFIRSNKLHNYRMNIEWIKNLDYYEVMGPILPIVIIYLGFIKIQNTLNFENRKSQIATQNKKYTIFLRKINSLSTHFQHGTPNVFFCQIVIAKSWKTLL
jgi:hypothetical protein